MHLSICQKSGHYFENSTMFSAPPTISTFTDAPPLSSKNVLLPTGPLPRAKYTNPIPNTPRFPPLIFFVLGTVFALSVLPTVM
ncbi:hypothetical protein K438DRAFT_1961948 [Mycena galopus ATCC 62051]|nr:hypothetical protein K438DRAFT_1961948 [Mycena galopus ATCC 62051]